MDFPVSILINFLWYVLHFVTEGWVADELTYTLHRVSFPYVKYLTAQLAIFIPLVAGDFKWLTCPFGASWEGIYTAIECMLVFVQRPGSITCLKVYGFV